MSANALQDVYRRAIVGEELQKNDYTALTCQFTPNKTDSPLKAQAFLTLTSICDRCRQRTGSSTDDEDDNGTLAIMGLFQGIIEEKMADVVEQPLFEAISFVAALFTVDRKAGITIFVRDGFQDSMLDALDLFPSSVDLHRAVAGVLAIACGYKSCRSALISRCLTWLESSHLRKLDSISTATISLALLKLSQGSSSDNASVGADTAMNLGNADKEDELFRLLRDAILNSKIPISDAIEGVAYLSTKSRFKGLILDDDTFLKHLVSFQPFLLQHAQNHTEIGPTPFGLAAIIANLCTYRPRLSEEQAQIEKLRRMAEPRAAEKTSRETMDLDDDTHVRLRAKRLVSVGAVNLLLVIGRITKSPSTRNLVGKAILGLVEDKDNRGQILQVGGAKILMSIISSSRRSSKKEDLAADRSKEEEYDDLASIQALAKLSITSSPLQVFGPDQSAALDAVRPLVFLLVCPASTLLQKFESMMALTNLSSAGPILAEKMAESMALMDKIELCLLEEHQLIRRASCELICNLIANSEYVCGRFSGEAKQEAGSSGFQRAKSRLQILVALTDVDDDPTRLAASGALATLTVSSTACKCLILLESEHHRAFLVLKQLLDPIGENGEAQDPGLLHRGVVCIRNILLNSDESLRKELAKEVANRGLVDAFVRIIKSAGQPTVPEAALQPAAEALKWLADSGVDLGS